MNSIADPNKRRKTPSVVNTTGGAPADPAKVAHSPATPASAVSQGSGAAESPAGAKRSGAPRAAGLTPPRSDRASAARRVAAEQQAWRDWRLMRRLRFEWCHEMNQRLWSRAWWS